MVSSEGGKEDGVVRSKNSYTKSRESKLSSHAPYPIREFMAYGVWGLFSCGEMSYYEVT